MERMRSSTGRWVTGDDFFARERELEILESRVRDGNHVLLTGQRRMGKTSLAKELGRRLEEQGWVSLFADVEGATCADDVIADIAEAIHPILPIASRISSAMSRWFDENVEEISASEFRLKIRAGLAGSWRRWGIELIDQCAQHDQPVLLIIDELPIFLLRLLRDEDGQEKVDEFLSWLRSVFQIQATESPVLLVSGSIGLGPLVQRLGIPDRINYFHPIRLGPWSRKTSIECLQCLAENSGLTINNDVANAAYEAIGSGIPHYVQSYFAHLHEFAVMRDRSHLTVDDADYVYRNSVLGPSGQSDLAHYEARLKNALDEDSHRIAIEILAEAATQGVFGASAKSSLVQWYEPTVPDVTQVVKEVLDVLKHDGYLYATEDGYRFSFQLLESWWRIRFRDHHSPLESRNSDIDRRATDG